MASLPHLVRDTAKIDAVEAFRRLATAQAAAFGSRRSADEIAVAWWGKDLRYLELIAKAGVQPTMTTGSGAALLQAEVAPFIRSLRHRSAAAALLSAAPMVSLATSASAAVPMAAANFPPPAFVAEGAPIPAIQGSFGTATVGPPHKLAMIAALSEELSEHSSQNAELVVGQAMEDAAARALDASLFSNAAATSARPAGLLNGVSAISPTAGGGVAAMVADIQALVAAIVSAAGGSSIMIFANPIQAVALNMLSANGAGYPVVPAPSLAAGTVVAVEANAFVSGFSGLPLIEVARETVVHLEGASPAQIGVAGSPNVAAAPTESLWQTNMLALRLILPCAWTMRGAGLVQFITGATW
jgi:HK97 family phage major capsid protein